MADDADRKFQTFTIWLALRNAAEQRNSWFFLGAAGGLTAVLALWGQIYCIRPLGVWILLILIGAVMAGAGVGAKAALEDAQKLNALARTVESLPVVRSTRYGFRAMHMAATPLLVGFTAAAILAVLAFTAYNARHLDPAMDPFCRPTQAQGGSGQGQQPHKP
jgi:hypothetical protein